MGPASPRPRRLDEIRAVQAITQAQLDELSRRLPPPPPRPHPSRDPGVDLDTGRRSWRDLPDTGYAIGRNCWNGHEYRRVWPCFESAAAFWSAPWWAVTWLFTLGRQGRLPWAWDEIGGDGPPMPPVADIGGSGDGRVRTANTGTR